MEDITLKRLKNAGWEPDRKIDISFVKTRYNDIGLEMPICVEVFLKQFGMLVVNSLEIHEDVNFNPLKVIGINLDAEYFRDLLIDYNINTTAYPIGMTCRGNLSILMVENNEFYCFTDGYLEKCGSNIEDMLDCLVGESKEAVIIE